MVHTHVLIPDYPNPFYLTNLPTGVIDINSNNNTSYDRSEK